MTKKHRTPGVDEKLFIETLRQGLNGENGGRYGGRPNVHTKAMGRKVGGSQYDFHISF